MICRLCDFRDFPHSVPFLAPQTHPLVVEIGFGDGRFWPAYTQGLGQKQFEQLPNYLGAELSGVSLLKAHRRLQAAGITNAVLTKLPATVLMREVVGLHSVDQLVVNFPDPWPKAGHLEHRLLRAPFFELLASRLASQGALLLTTDHEEYFEFAQHQAQQTGLFDIQLCQAPDAALATKYALKWRDLGLPVYHARFTLKTNTTTNKANDIPHIPHIPPTISYFPEEEKDVPHAILTLPEQSRQHARQNMTKHTQHTSAWTVVLLDCYLRQRRQQEQTEQKQNEASDDTPTPNFVFLVQVIEGELTQELLIETSIRSDGDHLVRLGKFGSPVITAGVKAAVGVVTDWWAERGALVKHRGY